MLTANDPVPTLRSLQASTLGGAQDAAKAKVKQAAQSYEAVFLNTMLQSMFTGIEEGGAWGGGQGSETWQGLLIDEFAKNIAARGGIGIAATVERELLALQEISQ
ncbi:rod-binding protein [Pannonibacter carbonis]|uniref:rod-binding protein n=1 Tax=Pannonibacter carbonis TaxID=2067569 RepID=UPI000D0F3B32|nr:rod-binding protein [Pannonibacter carbonis]